MYFYIVSQKNLLPVHRDGYLKKTAAMDISAMICLKSDFIVSWIEQVGSRILNYFH
jgi:hypothetical protein